MRFAIVDIETTGSWSAAHGITEIAILIHDGKKVIQTYETLINPETPILPFVQRLTGISNEMVRDAPKFCEVAKDIWTLTDGAVFVAHSVNFDYSFIRNAFSDLGADFRRKKLCTVRLSRRIFPGHPSYSLGNICSALGISAENRHRAMGDAKATASLFTLCMEHDSDGSIPKSLKKNSKEAVLPPLLPREDFEALPEKTGVYYFYDSHGRIIYIGKAVNIKSRIYSHFTGTANARLPFIASIARISYTLCGSELIALLLESDEIKKKYPVYNQAQKHDRGNYIMTGYFDTKGIHHLAVTRNTGKLEPVIAFRSMESARRFMSELIRDFDLCPKYCSIEATQGACFSFQMKKCSGVCAGKEEIHVYNNKVRSALDSLVSNGTRLIIDEGREFNERSVVLIENGVYKGFGYFDAGMEMDVEKARDVIQPYRHNADVQRILNSIEY